MSSFGERLRIEREKKGFNQKEFAEAIGVTPTRLNYWEKDKREPDFPNIRKMIDILGCDADYLIGTKLSSNNADMPKNKQPSETNKCEKTSDSSLSSAKLEFIKKIQKMPEDEIAALLAFANSLDSVRKVLHSDDRGDSSGI